HTRISRDWSSDVCSSDLYCEKIAETLLNQGFRAFTDLRNEKIGFKIREHTLNRVPYLIVVGDKEMEANTVAVRTRSGEDLGSMPLDALLEKLKAEVEKKGRV